MEKVFKNQHNIIRSYDLPPPGYQLGDKTNPIYDRRYDGIPVDALP
jgi:hypothetical protein